ncbi:UBX domain-containing protein 11-like [Asterias rubens]|uniref:UBX domain-containing protein 11-like n=1 Tax=Asterias rubens TaxID=7604 RepID=UPI0014557CD2|nr:UBX domain-containing protein 11-like [Asterias rubens]XP_033635566.1 UBX domain-containing protein 11-like [Asterias rubens]
MSNPLTNLRKARKTPLPGVHQSGQRVTPFRNPTDLFDEDESLLDEVLGRSSSRQSSVSTSRSDTVGNRTNRHLPKLTKDAKSTPSDYDLMTSMMSRIAQLELKVQFYAKEVIEKDKKINILDEKAKLLQKYQGGETGGESERVRNLERKCQSLQETIKDMEDFLSDYGMVWVGTADTEGEMSSEYDEISSPGEEVSRSTGMWRPGASVASREGPFHVDFDRIAENIKELNVVAGDGEKRIRHTTSGARFVAPDPIPLTLYANGIFMFNGPFRSYEEPTTQHLVQDLMDGYFPAELQARFPDGVPFQLFDKRDTIYNDPRNREQFPGTGNQLGGESKPSRLVPSSLDKGTSMEKSYTTSHDGKPVYETSQPPKPRMSVDQFLSKLPPSVMKDGKVIDVRASLAGDLRHDSSQPGVTIIDTPAVQDILDRVSSRPQSSASRPPSARSSITTLRIKSETGEHTFIVKMRFTDTIGDVRRYLDANRSHDSGEYKIVTTFPARIYDQQGLTLEECGLTPNAALHLRVDKK